MRVGQLAGNVAQLIGVVALVVFLFFLRAVALTIRNHGLAATIKQLLILSGTGVVLFLGMMLVAVASAVAGPSPGAMQGPVILVAGCGCTAGVLMLVAFIWYLITLFQVRDALTRYVRTRDR